VIVLVLGLASGACQTASPNPAQSWRWDKPQTTEETFSRDRYHCLRGATSRNSGALARFSDRAEVDPDRFAACMAVRGYTRSEAGEFGPPASKGTAAPRG
jgi:hypothetical protein